MRERQLNIEFRFFFKCDCVLVIPLLAFAKLLVRATHMNQTLKQYY